MKFDNNKFNVTKCDNTEFNVTRFVQPVDAWLVWLDWEQTEFIGVCNQLGVRALPP